MSRLANQACPMCGSGETKILNERMFQGRAWSLARCQDCGLHFTDPLPGDEEIRCFYEGDYHSGLYAKGIATLLADLRRRVWGVVRRFGLER